MKKIDSRVHSVVRKQTGSLWPLPLVNEVHLPTLCRNVWGSWPVAGDKIDLVEASLAKLGFVFHRRRMLYVRDTKPPMWKRVWWWSNDVQKVTHVSHVLVTALLPLAIVPLTGGLFAGWQVAMLIAILFSYKEIWKDAVAHKKMGRWKVQGREGVSAEFDGWVDALGPCAVAVGYILGSLA